MNMGTSLAFRAGILVLAGVAAASAQTYHATIVTEDGSPLPTSPQIIPSLSDRLVQECVIVNIFGNGSVQYVVNLRSRPYDPSTADVCTVSIRLKGYQPYPSHAAERRDGGAEADGTARGLDGLGQRAQCA